MAKGPYARYGTSSITGTQQAARTHTVVAGEDLTLIAALEYGQGYDQELWRNIAAENDIDDLDAIVSGQVLKIPPPSASST